MSPMFAFTVATEHIVIVLLAALAVAAIVALLVRRAPELAELREEMHQVSTLLEKNGMPHLAKVFAALAFGNLVKFIKEARFLRKQMTDPKLAAVLLSESFFAALKLRIEDAADRAKIVKVVNDWIAANPDKVQAVEDAVKTAAVVGATAAATAVKAAV